ncbi:hypothetical protein CC117_22155 [Parafrankia colletiae]|uniref:2TM domain-containing protein n=1 Tax=Parafrankia colletiae TaxID=573497 RepID=A0A1S1QL64_9ACTN|nr:2TM domain-containing protein [Parafrankia colletiae]MCK9901778.1 2TM domain-containing protein [Frankia sp. Cpl3]OHV34015.1 hypothetical protein CC117_22155 [Parafrankia colletiae]
MRANKTEGQLVWGLRIHVACYLLANLAQVLVWALATPDHFFWPLWSILAWGIGLGFHIWADHPPARSKARQ